MRASPSRSTRAIDQRIRPAAGVRPSVVCAGAIKAACVRVPACTTRSTTYTYTTELLVEIENEAGHRFCQISSTPTLSHGEILLVWWAKLQKKKLYSRNYINTSSFIFAHEDKYVLYVFSVVTTSPYRRCRVLICVEYENVGFHYVGNYT
jgi:hypothetical protein